MAALAQAEANRLLEASLGKNTFTAPTTPMKLSLHTTTGSASAAGTEVTGGSYARQDLSAALPSTGTNGSITSNAAVNFTGMPAATTTSAEVYDSNGTPRRAWWGALAASKTTGAGDTLQFPSGQITLALT
jgi:hypothetical protein